MREILFRGKRLQGGKWVEGYFYKSDINKRERESGKATLIFTPDCETFIYMPDAHNSVMVIPETVGQYIGLTDKNGTKIFGGDIVEYKDERAAIQWDADTARYIVEFDSYLMDFDNLYGHEVEVIGNIHDNPEVLEV